MLTVFVRTVLIYIFLTLVLRLMGKRQVGELEISELVSALLLSEVATMAIDDAEEPLSYAIIPILCILFLEVIISFAATKLPFIKKIFESPPSILICHGQLDQKELGKVRMSVEELLSELRLKGVASVGEVDYAIMEQNGQISVFKKSDLQSYTRGDAGCPVDKTGVDRLLIVDGEIKRENCRRMGYSEHKLEELLKKEKCRLKDVFLLAANDEGGTTLIKKDDTTA